ncbi:MAG: V-type ATP synthase subunit E [Thermoplasmata archaeon]
MTLERLVEEIRARAEAELARERSRIEGAKGQLLADRDRRLARVREESERTAQLDAARERAQKLASAKLTARKLAYEARERQMGEALERARTLLAGYTATDEYPIVVKRMYAFAVDRLGKAIRVRGREKDAALLKSVAGKAFDTTPLPIMGGLVAETHDGAKRLNLTFDELLRLREDRVRELLAA